VKITTHSRQPLYCQYITENNFFYLKNPNLMEIYYLIAKSCKKMEKIKEKDKI
jgi:hypothetical protein